MTERSGHSDSLRGTTPTMAKKLTQYWANEDRNEKEVTLHFLQKGKFHMEEKITYTEHEFNDTELQFATGGVPPSVKQAAKAAYALVGTGGSAYLLSKTGPKPPDTPGSAAGGVNKPKMSEDTMWRLNDLIHK